MEIDAGIDVEIDAEIDVIVPPRLVRGQTIGIAAPSGPVKMDRLRNGLACLGDAFELRIGASVTAMRAPGTRASSPRPTRSGSPS